MCTQHSPLPAGSKRAQRTALLPVLRSPWDRPAHHCVHHHFPPIICLLLCQVEDTIYASDANSTAYKYPLADAAILRVKGKPAGEAASSLQACHQSMPPAQSGSEAAGRHQAAGQPILRLPSHCLFPMFPMPDPRIAVEVPLDGTVYDLATGKVLSW